MRHGAALIHSGRLLAIGWNRSRVHDTWTLTQARADCTVHAEAAAIRNRNVAGCTVIVVRVLRDGTLGNSRPCPTCWTALETAGVRRVLYS